MKQGWRHPLESRYWLCYRLEMSVMPREAVMRCVRCMHTLPPEDDDEDE